MTSENPSIPTKVSLWKDKCVIFKPICGLSDKIGLLVLFEAVEVWSKREKNEDKKPKFEV